MAPSTGTRLTSKYMGSPSTGTLSSMGSERYFSDLGARQIPRSVSSVRSAPPIAERASLASSDISYRWPGGVRNERVGLPHQRYRTGSDASLYAPSSTGSYAPSSARTSVLREFELLHTPRAGTRTPSRLSSEWEPLHISREPSVASFGRTDLDDWMGYSRYGSRTIDTPVGSRGSTATLDSVGTPSMRSYTSDHSRLAERWDDGLTGGLVYPRRQPTAPRIDSPSTALLDTRALYPRITPRGSVNPFAQPSLPRTVSTGLGSRVSRGDGRFGNYFDHDTTLTSGSGTRMTSLPRRRGVLELQPSSRGSVIDLERYLGPGGADRFNGGFGNPAYDGSRASTRTFSDDSFRSWGHPPRQSLESSAGTSSLSSREPLLESLNAPWYRRGVPNLP